MERAVLVYTTWPSIVEAERAGRSIVERRLAACVNILPGMISHYWWEGKIERAEEVVMIIKSRASMAEPLRETVKQLHSYTTPAFMVLPVDMSIPNTTPGSCERRPNSIMPGAWPGMTSRIRRVAG
jgi:periplasmic divalent cation tolerance protein